MNESVLKALCEPKRFQLLQLMAQRGYCVSALARKSQLSESAVSQHMKILRDAGLVIGVKRGYYTHYCLDRDALGQVIEALTLLQNAKSTPCKGPFYGCEEAEYLQCKAYVPPEKRGENESC